jgi:heparin binding hemagglutinin HbhA
MARTNSTKSNKVDPTRPFYAAVGSVDVAVAFARTGLTEAQTRLAKVDFEPKALATQGRTLVSSRVDEIRGEAKSLPSRVQGAVNEYVAELGETVDDLNKQYVDLAARGRILVNKILGQQATQELEKQAKNTASRAKATGTTTKKTASQAARSTSKTAKTAKSSAKGTGTSAKKTAGAAKKATQDAAAKTGS